MVRERLVATTRRMVGLAVLVLAWNAAATRAHADITTRALERTTVGGKLGAGIATFSGEDADNDIVGYPHKIGMSIGAFAHVAVHQVIAVQAELVFASRGTRFELRRARDGTLHLRYLDLPVLARLAYPGEHLLAPYLLAGIRPGLLIDAQVVDDAGDTADQDDETRTLDLGLIAGAGATLDLTSWGWGGALLIEARFEQGVRSIDATAGQDDLDNRSLLLMLGYQRCLCR